MKVNLVLLEPEIPHNTGAIGRTCVAIDASLHLIKPLGFEITDKAIKRSGLDYWKDLDVYIYENYTDFLEKNENANIYFATTKALKTYADVKYKPNDFILFGKESKGIPEEILISNREKCIRIPMIEDHRSLNLANSASIIAYEALRQNDFVGLSQEGALHNSNW